MSENKINFTGITSIENTSSEMDPKVDIGKLYRLAIDKKNQKLFDDLIKNHPPKKDWDLLYYAIFQKSIFAEKIAKYCDDSTNDCSLIFLYACFAGNTQMAKKYYIIIQQNDVKIDFVKLPSDGIARITGKIPDHFFTKLMRIFKKDTENRDYFYILKLFTENLWRDVKTSEIIQLIRKNAKILNKILYLTSDSGCFRKIFNSMRVYARKKNYDKNKFNRVIIDHIIEYSGMYTEQKKYKIISKLLSFAREIPAVEDKYVGLLEHYGPGEYRIVKRLYSKYREQIEQCLSTEILVEIFPDVFTPDYIESKIPEETGYYCVKSLLYLAENHPSRVLQSGYFKKEYIGPEVSSNIHLCDKYLDIHTAYNIHMSTSHKWQLVDLFTSDRMIQAYSGGEFSDEDIQTKLYKMIREFAKIGVMPRGMYNLSENTSDIIKMIKVYSLSPAKVLEIYKEYIPKTVSGEFAIAFAELACKLDE